MRRRSLARFTALVAVFGIACGVASLIVARGITRGFTNEIQEKILNSTAHITVFPADGGVISDWRIIEREIEKLENVRAVSPTTYESAVIVTGKSINYAVLRVVDNLKSKHREPAGRDSPIEISIGAELADKGNLKISDEADIIVPQNDAVPQKFRVRVTEIFRTGVYDYDATWIYIQPEDFARVARTERFTPTVLSVTTTDIYQSDKTAAAIRGVLPPDFKVIDWQQANQPLFSALSLEKKVSLIIVSLVIFIAILNITATLALLVNERKYDIAILRTCGARTSSLLKMFFIEGLLLGSLGIFGGTILGLILCYAGNYFKIISLPTEIYSVSSVSLQPNPSDIFLIVTVTLILCLLSTVYPALQAAKIKPLENLRNS